MRSFAGYPFKQYVGQQYALPIRLGALSGVTVPLFFQWLSYGAATAFPNIAVKCDLSVKNVATMIGSIRSCYIDNMGSDVPVYVQFPSTGYTVVAQPNSAGWYPVYTGDLQVVVAASGFITGDIPQTLILLTNIPIPASIDLELQQSTDLWLASNTISRGNTIYNTNLGSPALGDQFATYTLRVDNGLVTQTVFNFGGGFVYLTNISASLTNVKNAGSMSLQIFFESTGVAGIFYTLLYSNSIATPQNYQVLPPTPGNFKLDGSQLWRIRVANIVDAALGTVTCNFAFTTNPK